MTVNGFSIIGTPAMESLLSMPDLVVNNILPNRVMQRMSREDIGMKLIYSSAFEDGSRIRGLLHLHYIITDIYDNIAVLALESYDYEKKQ
nr:MAG TPA: hypothetical protein [Caudoviricetes sp.]